MIRLEIYGDDREWHTVHPFSPEEVEGMVRQRIPLNCAHCRGEITELQPMLGHRGILHTSGEAHMVAIQSCMERECIRKTTKLILKRYKDTSRLVLMRWDSKLNQICMCVPMKDGGL